MGRAVEIVALAHWMSGDGEEIVGAGEDCEHEEFWWWRGGFVGGAEVGGEVDAMGRWDRVT